MLLYFPQWVVDIYLNICGYLSMLTGIALVGPRNLQISLPAVCNHSCTFCITDIHGKGSPRGRETITLDMIKNIVKDAIDCNTLRFNLVSNGEPLMYPDIKRLISFITEQSRGKARTKIITNGSLLPKFDRSFLENNNVEIWLSLHSFDFEIWKQKHKPIYQEPEKTFQEMIDYLISYSGKITLHSVISKINQSHLKSMIDLVAKLHNVTVNFSIVKKHDDLLPDNLDEDQLREMQKELKELSIKSNIDSVLDHHIDIFVEDDSEEKDENHINDFYLQNGCYANHVMSFVDDEGMFYFCGVNNGLGKLQSYDYKSLYFEKAKNLRKQARRINYSKQTVKDCDCKNCPHIDINSMANRVLP